MNIFRSRTGLRRKPALTLAVLLLAAFWMSCCARAGEPLSNTEGDVQPSAGPCDGSGSGPEDQERPDKGQWFLFWGNVNSHPRLETASKLIDRRINRPFRSLAPGFDDIETFADQRDDLMIWSPFVGVGRVLSERWDVFLQAGGAAGKVRTKATDPSLLLLPLHTDVTLKRSNIFATAGVNFFPLGTAERGKYESLKNRLKQTKPYVGSTFNWNRLTFDAKIKAGLRPFGNVIQAHESDEWQIWSVGAVVGADVPMTKRSTFSFNATYNFFIDHGHDFSGPSFSIFCKRFF